MKSPIVTVRALRRQGIWYLYIICPYCGKEHLHDGGHGEMPTLGLRQPLCANGDKLPKYQLAIRIHKGERVATQ